MYWIIRKDSMNFSLLILCKLHTANIYNCGHGAIYLLLTNFALQIPKNICKAEMKNSNICEI